MVGVKGRTSVRLIGAQQLETDFTRMQRLSQEGKQEYLQILATIFLAALVKFAPVKTGRYIRSWRVKQQLPNKIVVGPATIATPRQNDTGGTSPGISPARLAVILEFSGAAPHTIRPRNKKALAFTFGGETIFFTVVNHPGIKPQPHIRPALMETKRKAKGIAYAVATRYAPIKKWKDSLARGARANGYEGPIPPRQTGRNSKDTSANIGRGTKANFRPKLSAGLSGKRIRSKGLTRMVGTSESGRKSITKIGGQRAGAGIERFR